jgi:hypothetical protein
VDGGDAGGGENVYDLIRTCMVWTNIRSKIDLGFKRDNPWIIATWEEGKKLALITELVCPYMEPLCRVSRGKTGEADTGKWDWTNRLQRG